MRTTRLTILFAGLGLAACDDSGGSPAGTGLQIDVAPLTFPGISRVCFDLRVTNAAGGGGQVVWSQGAVGQRFGSGDTGAICSDQFGNSDGGDVTYIGTCDASGQEDPGDAAGERTNSVTLWVDSIWTSDGATMSPIEANGPDGWQDPCPGGCTLDVLCEENADALVEFNLTVMRQANQGFFDVAVNFADVFCSAKVDTCYAPDRPIELLHGDGVRDGEDRDHTGVFAFACTGGPGNLTTELLLGTPTITCTSPAVTFTLPVAGVEAGNRTVAVAGIGEVQYALYYGAEQLACGAGIPCNKRYLNIAINLEDLPASGCSLSMMATAQGSDNVVVVNGTVSQNGSTYPYVEVDAVPLAAGTCTINPLNVTGSAVSTFYGASANMVGGEAADLMCISYTGTGLPQAIAVPGVDPYASADTARVVSTIGELGSMTGLASPIPSQCDPNVAGGRNASEFNVWTSNVTGRVIFSFSFGPTNPNRWLVGSEFVVIHEREGVRTTFVLTPFARDGFGFPPTIFYDYNRAVEGVLPGDKLYFGVTIPPALLATYPANASYSLSFLPFAIQ